jgi:hypothetical protein
MKQSAAALAIAAAAVFATCPHTAHAATLTGDAALVIGSVPALVTVTAPAPLKSTVTITVTATGLDAYAAVTTDATACTSPAPAVFTCTYADTKQDIAIPFTLTPATEADLTETDTITGALTAEDATGATSLPVTVTGNAPAPAPSPSPEPSEEPSDPFPSDPAPVETITETETVTEYLPGATEYVNTGTTGGTGAGGYAPLPSTDPAPVLPDVEPSYSPAPITEGAPLALGATATGNTGGVNWWATAGIGAAALAAALTAAAVKRRRARRDDADAGDAGDAGDAEPDTATDADATKEMPSVEAENAARAGK